ncbi:MAG TPA: hypothetical protein VG797_11260 [Phycisphaerales bacterium]|nr:hypothetical protein [Phycisphaerales bacterium]
MGAAAVPPAGKTLEAWQAIDGWVKRWKAPGEAQAIDPAGTKGACVTLRLSGQVIGRATRMGESGSTAWMAARDAMVEANQRFPVERDAMREEHIAEMLPRVMVDVQVAGTLVPLLGETFDAAAMELSPGIDGVAARAGDKTIGFFPGVMLATGTTPAEAMRSAAGEIGLPPLELGQLRKVHGLVVYRFSCRHLAACAPGEQPRFLMRGGSVIPLASVSMTGLRQFADRAAAHLMMHDWPGSEPNGMTGDYKPVMDRFEPVVAPPLEQSVAAMALLRYAATTGTAPSDAEKARKFAARVLGDLKTIADGEEDPLTSVPSASAFVAAWWEARRWDEGAFPLDDEFYGRAVVQVKTALLASGEWNGEVPGAARALAALAMVRASEGESSLRTSAERAVRSLFRDTSRGDLVSMMPWLGWAELELAGAKGEVPSLAALVDMRQTMWKFQLADADVGECLDFTGGLLFTRSRNPLPTWTTLRPVAFAATMLSDERLTPPDLFARELSSLRRSMRFMFQLAPDDAAAHMYRDPKRAMGGVRRAVWDQTLGLDSTALSLLAACEVLKAITPAATPENGR